MCLKYITQIIKHFLNDIMYMYYIVIKILYWPELKTMQQLFFLFEKRKAGQTNCKKINENKGDSNNYRIIVSIFKPIYYHHLSYWFNKHVRFARQPSSSEKERKKISICSPSKNHQTDIVSWVSSPTIWKMFHPVGRGTSACVWLCLFTVTREVIKKNVGRNVPPSRATCNRALIQHTWPLPHTSATLIKAPEKTRRHTHTHSIYLYESSSQLMRVV